jgi:hypothetical protein
MGLSTTPRASQGVLGSRRSAAQPRELGRVVGRTERARPSLHAARGSIDVTIAMVSTGPSVDPASRCDRTCSR